MVPWLLLSFLYASFQLTDSLCFKLEGTFVDEATPLCSILSSLFPGRSWNIEILKRGFKGVFVAFPFGHLVRAFLLAVLHRELSLAAAHRAFL